MQTIKRDKEGFLLNVNDWQKETALALAKEENLALTEAHWQVILLLRQFYQTYARLPTLRVLVNYIKQSAGEALGNSATLQVLFPEGALRQAAKLAGLPKPPHCV